ncbi:glutaredoxin family protein [Microbacterium sp.]|uniref:glutaredoxin family protein n=1 Tax=Microbacterium sp. TaxID=51671 RepID=UPI003C282784
MNTVVVYTTGDACMQCRLTKQALDAVGLAYADIDLTDPHNAAARDYVTAELGYSSAPVVVVDDHDHWTGFRPDRIKQVATCSDARPTSERS